jgi:hypothetical protein
MMALCKKAISQAQDIALSDKEFKVPEEFLWELFWAAYSC